jgi:hypothetical protein
MAEFKPKLISFQKENYEKEMAKYQNFKLDYKHAQSRWSNLLELDLKDIDLTKERAFKDICKAFAKAWEKQNTLQLRPLKLMEAREINIKQLITDLDHIRTTARTKPIKKDFEVWTQNEDQNKRLEICLNFIEMLPFLKNAGISFRNNYQAPIMMGVSTPTPNQYFIKQNLR